MICNITRASMTSGLPSETCEWQRGLLMAHPGQQPCSHTFGCAKSLLCWQRARFSASCGKCELILFTFHSEGEEIVPWRS